FFSVSLVGRPKNRGKKFYDISKRCLKKNGFFIKKKTDRKKKGEGKKKEIFGGGKNKVGSGGWGG
ncbi:hypothetical protein, partial [Salmonella enterica]|uniref:hypothetical protein n=1 Tax=Salmonella enterica TaxID=28901 RepID=UPI000EC2694F